MFIKIGAPSDHHFGQPLGLLSDCHRRIEHFLRILAALAEDVAGTHLTLRQRGQLESALTYFATAARIHTADEEASLFPRLRAPGPGARQAVDLLTRLEADHASAERRHDAVDALGRRWLADGVLNARATGDLRGHVAALQEMYAAHIAIEDGELFPLAGRLLAPEQIAAIGTEMAARRCASAASAAPAAR